MTPAFSLIQVLVPILRQEVGSQPCSQPNLTCSCLAVGFSSQEAVVEFERSIKSQVPSETERLLQRMGFRRISEAHCWYVFFKLQTPSTRISLHGTGALYTEPILSSLTVRWRFKICLYYTCLQWWHVALLGEESTQTVEFSWIYPDTFPPSCRGTVWSHHTTDTADTTVGADNRLARGDVTGNSARWEKLISFGRGGVGWWPTTF